MAAIGSEIPQNPTKIHEFCAARQPRRRALVKSLAAAAAVIALQKREGAR
ncbi:MAG: hypothetical protein ACR652_10840 [Methylocystis sp.]